LSVKDVFEIQIVDAQLVSETLALNEPTVFENGAEITDTVVGPKGNVLYFLGA